MSHRPLFTTTALAAALLLGAAPGQAAGPNFVTDVIIEGSLCVGLDCAPGVSFGFDTQILKENNLRIFFDDTSSTLSFPDQDWRIEVNQSVNGGEEWFAIQDATAGTVPFTIEAGASTHSLWIDNTRRIGMGTRSPVVELHIKDGDTPTVRLEQDNTNGFNPQTWDVAGNEAGFFIRDATSGSTLPFRIITGGAPTNALVIDANGDVGIGAGTNPQAPLEIRRSGNVQLYLTNSADNTNWRLAHRGGDGRFSFVHSTLGTALLLDDATGDMTLTGDLITGGAGTCAPPNPPCDAVFDPAVYTVPSIEDHAAAMWKNRHLPAVGPTGPGEQVNVSDKMLRMLNELEHAHIYIAELNERIKLLEDQLTRDVD